MVFFGFGGLRGGGGEEEGMCFLKKKIDLKESVVNSCTFLERKKMTGCMGGWRPLPMQSDIYFFVVLHLICATPRFHS